MAGRKRTPIKVKAYVDVNGVLSDVDTLNVAQKQRLANALQVTMLNELYRGQYTFYMPGEIPPDAKGPFYTLPCRPQTTE